MTIQKTQSTSAEAPPVSGTIIALGSGMRVANIVLEAAIAFLLMPLVVRTLGDRMYGLWTVVGTIIGYYGLLDLGLSTAITRHVAGAMGAGKAGDAATIASTSLRVYAVLGLVAVLVTGGLAMAARAFFPDPADAVLFRKVILIVGISLAAGFPVRVFSGVLASQVRHYLISGARIASLILRSALTYYAARRGAGITALAWANCLATILEQTLLIVFCRIALPSIPVGFRLWSTATAKKLFGYSSLALVAATGETLRFQISAIVVSAFLGLNAVTHFRVASFMTGQYISIIVASMGVIVPVFSRLEGQGDRERLKEMFFRSTRISIVLASFIGFGLIAWGRPFIERWMGAPYLDAFPCMVVMTVGCIIDLSQTTTSALFYGISKHGFYAVFNVAEGLLNIGLSLIFVRWWGIFGVALGTSVAMALMRLVLQPLYLCRVLSITPWQYLRGIGGTAGIVALALVVPALLSLRFAAPSYPSLVILGAVCFLLYAVPVWLLVVRKTPFRELLGGHGPSAPEAAE
jgi:O-antigen/teichoic acid export membrane protein